MFATIVMPVKNGSKTIAAAIESVLQETHFPMELLVIDDASTDDTRQCVSRFEDPRVRLMQNRGRGQSEALNTGIANARGNVFMRCDADDLYAPGRIDWQLERLAAEPHIQGVCGEVSAITNDGKVLGRLSNPIRSEESASALLNCGQMCSHLGAYAIRIDTVREAGCFREFFKYSQDYDFLFRVAQRHALQFVGKPAYTIRFSSGSVCRRTPFKIRQWYKAKAQEFRIERLSQGTDPLQRGELITPPDEKDAPPEVERVNRSISDVLGGIAWEHFREEAYFDAITAATRAVSWTPLRLSAYISLTKLFLLTSTKTLSGILNQR